MNFFAVYFNICIPEVSSGKCESKPREGGVSSHESLRERAVDDVKWAEERKLMRDPETLLPGQQQIWRDAMLF